MFTWAGDLHVVRPNIFFLIIENLCLTDSQEAISSLLLTAVNTRELNVKGQLLNSLSFIGAIYATLAEDMSVHLRGR